MTHQEIKKHEIIEQYVMNKLPPDERRAFQEHFFECDECFEQAQVTARFIAGVREASESGVLAANRVLANEATGWSSRLRLLRPMFAFSFAVLLLLAVALVWLFLNRIPALRPEVAREAQTEKESEQTGPRNLDTTKEQLDEKQKQVDTERIEPTKPKDELDTTASNRNRQRPPKNLVAANIPMVTLESSRDPGSENRLTIPARAEEILLSIPVEPGTRFESFQVHILSKTKQPVEAVTHAKPNRHGLLRVRVGAGRFQSGRYVVELYGARGRHTELLGEYDLQVVKK